MNTTTDLPANVDLSSEVAEWIEAFDDVVASEGPQQGAELLSAIRQRARDVWRQLLFPVNDNHNYR
jgi:pyruvate dehydrogenase E1 component